MATFTGSERVPIPIRMISASDLGELLVGERPEPAEPDQPHLLPVLAHLADGHLHGEREGPHPHQDDLRVRSGRAARRGTAGTSGAGPAPPSSRPGASCGWPPSRGARGSPSPSG